MSKVDHVWGAKLLAYWAREVWAAVPDAELHASTKGSFLAVFAVRADRMREVSYSIPHGSIPTEREIHAAIQTRVDELMKPPGLPGERR